MRINRACRPTPERLESLCPVSSLVLAALPEEYPAHPVHAASRPAREYVGTPHATTGSGAVRRPGISGSSAGRRGETPIPATAPRLRGVVGGMPLPLARWGRQAPSNVRMVPTSGLPLPGGDQPWVTAGAPTAPAVVAAPSPVAAGLSPTAGRGATGPRAGEWPSILAAADPGTTSAPARGLSGGISFETSSVLPGTEDPAPKARISSPGLHNDEVGPIPEVIQGMRYDAAFTVLVGATDPNVPGETGTQYEVVSYTWTFPSGAVKGYGSFNYLLEQDTTTSSGNFYAVFASHPTDTDGQGASIARANPDAEFDVDDLEKRYDEVQPNGFPATDHVIETFYWGPEVAPGEQQVSVSVTLRKIVNGVNQGTITVGDSVKLNVNRPTGNIQILEFGEAGVTGANVSTDYQWLQFDVNTTQPLTANSPVGIQWKATVNPTLNFGGKFRLTQTEDHHERRDYTWLGTAYTEWDDSVWLNNSVLVQPGWVVDDMDYPGNYLDEPGNPQVTVAEVGHNLYGDDSPFSELTLPYWGATPSTWWRSDNFTMTLMYCPDPNGTAGGKPTAIWVPVGKVNWSWGAFATYNAGTGKWDEGPEAPRQSHDQYQPTTTFPVWEHSVREFSGQFNRRVP